MIKKTYNLFIYILPISIGILSVSCKNSSVPQLPSQSLTAQVIKAVYDQDSSFRTDSTIVHCRLVKYNFETDSTNSFPPPPEVHDTNYSFKDLQKLFRNVKYDPGIEDSLYFKFQTDIPYKMYINSDYTNTMLLTDTIIPFDYFKFGYKIATFHQPLFTADSSYVLTQYDIILGVRSCIAEDFPHNERSVTLILRRNNGNWEIQYRHEDFVNKNAYIKYVPPGLNI